MYPIVSELIERLDADVRELFEERAGIVEYEGRPSEGGGRVVCLAGCSAPPPLGAHRRDRGAVRDREGNVLAPDDRCRCTTPRHAIRRWRCVLG